jgi:hypothetical protein
MQTELEADRKSRYVSTGIDHFVENHNVKSHKVDRKISGRSLCQKAFWHVTYGGLPMATKACEWLG